MPGIDTRIESGVAKLAADRARVVWATWFGGSGDESSEVVVSVDRGAIRRRACSDKAEPDTIVPLPHRGAACYRCAVAGV
jgi:hypothetical protein